MYINIYCKVNGINYAVYSVKSLVYSVIVNTASLIKTQFCVQVRKIKETEITGSLWPGRCNNAMTTELLIEVSPRGHV